MLNGPKCMVMCQKREQGHRSKVEKMSLPLPFSNTLAGKTWILGIDWPVDPPIIIFTSSGLVLATRQLDKQVSCQAPQALADCGRHEQFDT